MASLELWHWNGTDENGFALLNQPDGAEIRAIVRGNAERSINDVVPVIRDGGINVVKLPSIGPDGLVRSTLREKTEIKILSTLYNAVSGNREFWISGDRPEPELVAEIPGLSNNPSILDLGNKQVNPSISISDIQLLNTGGKDGWVFGFYYIDSTQPSSIDFYLVRPGQIVSHAFTIGPSDPDILQIGNVGLGFVFWGDRLISQSSPDYQQEYVSYRVDDDGITTENTVTYNGSSLIPATDALVGKWAKSFYGYDLYASYSATDGSLGQVLPPYIADALGNEVYDFRDDNASPVFLGEAYNGIKLSERIISTPQINYQRRSNLHGKEVFRSPNLFSGAYNIVKVSIEGQVNLLDSRDDGLLSFPLPENGTAVRIAAFRG